jgi:hypothetical protein
MTLRLAKSNQPLMLVIIPLIILICWINPITHSNINIDTNSTMPLYALFIRIFPLNEFMSKILGCFILAAIALLISRLNTKFIFIPERTYLPSIIYIMIVFSIIHIDLAHPLLIAMLLFLLAFERMLDSYKNENLTYNSFDASLFIGIASLFYFQSIFLLLFIWATLSVLRPFYWREWVFTILGAGLPYVFFFGIAYLFNLDLGSFYNAVEICFLKTSISSFELHEYIFLAFLFIVVVLSSQYIMKTMGSIKILARKSFNLFLFLFLFSVLLYSTINSMSTEIVILSGLPLSMVISNYFIISRKNKWKEILFDLFVLVFILTQLLNLKL